MSHRVSNTISKWMALVALLLVGSIAAGCATYQPPQDLPRDKAATVKTDPGHKALAIDRVDGASISGMVAIGLGRNRDTVTLAPGKHKITVEYLEYPKQGFADLWLSAEAGRDYVIKGESHGYQFRVWTEALPQASATADPASNDQLKK